MATPRRLLRTPSHILQIETARLWTPFSEQADLLASLDRFSQAASMAVERASIIEDILHAISESTPVAEPKPATIASLHSILPHSRQLEVVLGTLLHNRLPLCYDGLTPKVEKADLRTLVTESARRWQQSTSHSDVFVKIVEVLQSQQWSDSTADIAVSLIYRDPFTRGPVLEWLKGDVSTLCTTPHVARVLYALVDCGFLATFDQEDLAQLVLPYRRVLRGLARGKNTEDAGSLCALYVRTACAMVEQLGVIRNYLLGALQKECEKMGTSTMSLSMIRLVASLSANLEAGLTDVAEDLLSKALPWVVQLLASGEALSPGEVDALTDLSTSCVTWHTTVN